MRFDAVASQRLFKAIKLLPHCSLPGEGAVQQFSHWKWQRASTWPCVPSLSLPWVTQSWGNAEFPTLCTHCPLPQPLFAFRLAARLDCLIFLKISGKAMWSSRLYPRLCAEVRTDRELCVHVRSVGWRSPFDSLLHSQLPDARLLRVLSHSP